MIISYAVFCLKKFFFNDTATTEIYPTRGSSAASDVYKRQALYNSKSLFFYELILPVIPPITNCSLGKEGAIWEVVFILFGHWPYIKEPRAGVLTLAWTQSLSNSPPYWWDIKSLRSLNGQLIYIVTLWSDTVFMKFKILVLPWLVWLSGLSARLQSKGSPVQFPVRAPAWVVGQVPRRECARDNHTLMMFLSLSFSFPSPLSLKKKYILKKKSWSLHFRKHSTHL